MVTGSDGSQEGFKLGKNTARLASRKMAGGAWSLSTARGSIPGLVEQCGSQPMPREGAHGDPGQRP